MSAIEIYKKAQALIRKSGTNNPFVIASDNNIMVKKVTDFKRLKGLYTVIKRKRIIILNGNLPYEEQKLVCAHEIGHDIMHREFAKSIVLHEYVLCDIKEKTEHEANMFAADILFDDGKIEELARTCLFDADKMAQSLGASEDIVKIKLSNMRVRGYNFNLNPNMTTNSKNNLPDGALDSPYAG